MNNQSGFYLKKKSPVPYRDINKTFFFTDAVDRGKQDSSRTRMNLDSSNRRRAIRSDKGGGESV